MARTNQTHLPILVVAGASAALGITSLFLREARRARAPSQPDEGSHVTTKIEPAQSTAGLVNRTSSEFLATITLVGADPTLETNILLESEKQGDEVARKVIGARGGSWRGILPATRWTARAAWDAERAYRIIKACDVSFDEPDAALTLSRHSSRFIAAIDALTGEAIESGSLYTSIGSDRDAEDDVIWIARDLPFPIEIGDLTGSITVEAPGYAASIVPRETLGFYALVRLDPLSWVEVTNATDSVATMGILAVRDAPSIRWIVVNPFDSAVTEYLPNGQYHLFLQEGTCASLIGSLLVSSGKNEVAVDASTRRDAAGCGSLTANLVLPGASPDWSVGISSAEFRLPDERIRTWMDVGNNAYEKTWKVPPGAYTFDVAPSHTQTQALVVAGQETHVVIDLSDVVECSFSFSVGDESSTSVWVDWGYGDGSGGVQGSFACWSGVVTRVWCQAQELWIRAYSAERASRLEVIDDPRKCLSPKQIVLSSRIARQDILTLGSEGLVTVPDLLTRLEATAVNHSGAFVRARSLKCGTSISGYSLLFSEVGAYTLSVFSAPPGSPGRRATWSKEIVVGYGDAPLILPVR